MNKGVIGVSTGHVCIYKGACPFRVFITKLPYCGGSMYKHLRILCKYYVRDKNVDA